MLDKQTKLNLSFEQLIAQAKAQPPVKRGRKATAKPAKSTRWQSTAEKEAAASDDFTTTQKMLREMKLARCVPTSVHLHMVRQLCTCGCEFIAVNSAPLLKRVSPALTHFEQIPEGDLGKWDALPRFVDYQDISLTSCPNCFSESIAL